MKALTVRQPYAWAIATGHKTVENRSRPTNHRGPLAIHAGAAWSPIGGIDDRVLEVFGPYMTGQDYAFGAIDPAVHHDRLIFRAVIAVVDVVGCHRAVDTNPGTCCKPWGSVDLFGDMWHWELAGARQLATPIPAKGRLGLWDIDVDDPATSSAALGGVTPEPPKETDHG